MANVLRPKVKITGRVTFHNSLQSVASKTLSLGDLKEDKQKTNMSPDEELCAYCLFKYL